MSLQRQPDDQEGSLREPAAPRLPTQHGLKLQIGDGGHPQQAQLGKPARRLLHEGWTLVAEAEDPALGLL